MITLVRDVPDPPICRSRDLKGPCEFAGACPESRQRLNHYEGLRGPACWAWLQRAGDVAERWHGAAWRVPDAVTAKREAALEREAIRAEGAG